jgi:serine phosphatase RsbU (regulator of sigma subunit)/anti-sigma regulatory factor (Ser/Thr protein kinase)
VASATTTATPVATFSASAQTLTLGIDKAGKILQHDRTAPDILTGPHDALLGSDLSALITGPGNPAEAFRALIEAACADRDSTTVLTIRTASRSLVDAIVTIEPIRSADPHLLAQVTMRMPPPAAERFIDPALMRHALLDGAAKRLGGALDLDQIAPALVNILVPHFCNAASLLVLESVLADSEHPGLGHGSGQLVRRLALAHDDGDPSWDSTFPIGEVLRYPAKSLQARCLDTGEPVAAVIDAATAIDLATTWGRSPVARLISESSSLILPLLLADQVMLGFFTCTRDRNHHRFDAYDTEIGMEFANRAAQLMDGARKYNRERATALTLQRSMLPNALSAPESVEVRHRYLPGSKLIEVGGDWYESIALPGGRVALVIGDVAGHGVRAAVTMGRLRTAIKTLTMLELTASETLQRLNELMQELGVFEPHFATCVFAIYDSVDGSCEVASAGHLPPLLVHPDGSSEFLDVSPAPPLGTTASPIKSRTLQIDDGSILMLYTDGLVERRGEDIDEGLARLRALFAPGAATRQLDELCRAALADVYSDHQRDDIAILLARLRKIAPDRHVSWNLAAKTTAARRARSLIRRPLRQWGLADLIPVAELAVSELVTNAVRYSHSKIGLRLVLEGGLFCEVLDDSAALPRLRHAGDDEERGRGLQVVSQIAQRWGTRRTATGKVVWCEIAVPSASSDISAGSGGASASVSTATPATSTVRPDQATPPPPRGPATRTGRTAWPSAFL